MITRIEYQSKDGKKSAQVQNWGRGQWRVERQRRVGRLWRGQTITDFMRRPQAQALARKWVSR